jgi:hypothetical protein
VEDAEEQVGGDVGGVAVGDGGDAGAGGLGQAGDLSVGEFFLSDDVDDFGVEFAAEADWGAFGGMSWKLEKGKWKLGRGIDRLVCGMGRSSQGSSTAHADAFAGSECERKGIGMLRSE